MFEHSLKASNSYNVYERSLTETIWRKSISAITPGIVLVRGFLRDTRSNKWRALLGILIPVY